MSTREAAAAGERPDDLIAIPRKNVMQCTGNDGGYKGFRCLACGASDWEMHFKHKPKCPMVSRAASAPQAVRMLTDEEIMSAWRNGGRWPHSYRAIIFKFCEENGLVPSAPQDKAPR